MNVTRIPFNIRSIMLALKRNQQIVLIKRYKIIGKIIPEKENIQV